MKDTVPTLLDKREKCIENVSMDMVKEICTEMFWGEEAGPVRKVVSSRNTDTIARLDRLTEENQDNNESLNRITEETEDLKLSLDASSKEIFEEK